MTPEAIEILTDTDFPRYVSPEHEDYQRLIGARQWQCTYCNAISFSDEISAADGYCSFHPAGAGNHHFEEVK